MSEVAAIDHYSTAGEMAAALRTREISARELLDLHLARIDEVNPQVNALVSIDPDLAREQATTADERLANGEDVGPLHGLPFAVKDTLAVAGWRTTHGSPLMADHIPAADELIVERVRAAGAVLVAKSNVPEFAAGSHTYNTIFGTTVNPHDLRRSAGGSSGGSAAALASGMVPLADGTDMGGSLRNPASFNNIVGLRPGAGRVPEWPRANGWEATAVSGPMARTVADLALLLSVQAGPSSRVPLAMESPGSIFAEPLDQAGDAALDGLRIAMSADLGGAFAVDHEVARILGEQSSVLEQAGSIVVDAHPDLHEAEDTFRTLRAWNFQDRFADQLAADPAAFKASLADNIRAGAGLSGADIARAYAQRTTLAERMRIFFESHDVLVLPVSQVPPFPADQEYPHEINGQAQETYLDWMRSSYLISVTGCPAISVPAGFTSHGLPVGIQIVAPHAGERRLLEIAHAFEQRTRVGERRPAFAGEGGVDPRTLGTR